MSEKTPATSTPCPICSVPVSCCEEGYGGPDRSYYDCRNCGQYSISGTALACIGRLDDKARALLSATTWQRQNEGGKPPVIYETHLEAAERESLPDPAEQLDRLILFLGAHQQSPGIHLEIPLGCLRAKFGGLTVGDESFIVSSAVSAQLLDNKLSHMRGHGIRLTMAGWSRFRELQRGSSTSPSTSTTAERVRVFLSHRANHKKEVSQLKECLGKCGIECFVAHEDIEPTEDWQHEIESALRSMDVLVALLTPDFHGSNWTDQEVGFAVARKVPIIAVCLGQDPHGFIGKNQGLRGCSWGDIDGMTAKIYALLHKCLPDQSRLFEAALAAYAASTSWDDSVWKVKKVLAAFDTLTPVQVETIVHAWRENLENRNSFVGRDSLIPLLKKWTGQEWMLDKDKDELRRTDNVHA